MNRRQFLHSAAGIVTLAAASVRVPGAIGASPIPIGQIGVTHSHAAGKMEAVRRLNDLFVVAGIVESDAKARAEAAASGTYAGLEWRTETELLGTPGLQAVLVETGFEEAPLVARRAIAAGKHVHLDKPGALAHLPFKAMRQEAEERGLTVQMGYMLRYNPAFELLFQAVREGWFGEILEVDAMMGKQANESTRRTLRELPGGGMFELACHVIDAAVTILGKPAAVHAFRKPSRGPADPTPDNQVAVLEYPKAVATIRCNHTDPFGFPRRRFLVAGTRGSMEILPLESGRATLFLDTPRGPYAKGQQPIQLKVPAGRYDGEFMDLARVIRGEKRLAWNAAHDIAVHETILRASGVWPDGR